MGGKKESTQRVAEPGKNEAEAPAVLPVPIATSVAMPAAALPAAAAPLVAQPIPAATSAAGVVPNIPNMVLVGGQWMGVQSLGLGVQADGSVFGHGGIVNT